jgi:hypothetical protein
MSDQLIAKPLRQRIWELAVILLIGAPASAQVQAGTNAMPVAQWTFNDSDAKAKKDSGGAKDSKDNAAILEEMRQMRQLIERQESRVNQLEAEKSAALVKVASPGQCRPLPLLRKGVLFQLPAV